MADNYDMRRDIVKEVAEKTVERMADAFEKVKDDEFVDQKIIELGLSKHPLV